VSAADSPADSDELPQVAKALPRDDPTRTTKLRKRFGSQIYKRYKALKGAVRQYVLAENRFGIQNAAVADAVANRAIALGSATTPPHARGRANDGDAPVFYAPNAQIPGMPDPSKVPAITPPASPSWEFPEDSKKVQAFTEWFRGAQNAILLGGGGAGPSAGVGWANEYVRYAYFRGLDFAQDVLQSQGFVGEDIDVMDTFNMPVHQSALALIYQRQYTGLKGITDEVDKQVSRILAEGFAAGENPRTIARTINDRVDKIGITRGRTLARTEIVRSYNEATLNRFEQVVGGDASVQLYAEFSTARDSRVCPICAALEGTTFRIKDAHNVIPQHPNCRCAWVPVKTNTSAAASARNRRIALNHQEHTHSITNSPVA
jgi:SPP1 gp7 family putative phage head morphogenesis protein